MYTQHNINVTYYIIIYVFSIFLVLVKYTNKFLQSYPYKRNLFMVVKLEKLKGLEVEYLKRVTYGNLTNTLRFA